MMTISEIELYNIIKSKIGDKEAESLVSFVKDEVKTKFNDHRDTLASKKDLAEIKADIIKWMFIFWIGQLAAVLTIVKLL